MLAVPQLHPMIILNSPISYTASTCGYCHSQKRKLGSQSHGVHLFQLSAADYEYLINNNWRRSGNYLYRPDPLRSCCTHWTIRTNNSMIKLTKELKKFIKKWQKFINVEPANGVSIDSIGEFELKSNKFKSILTSNTFTVEKFELFKKYQNIIHNDDDTSENSFKNFLCTSPIINSNGFGDFNDQVNWDLINNEWSKRKIGREMQKFQGSIHECYYFNDQLIAMSVLDILPNSVSCVYFIYDPDFKHLSLGNLSILRELAMAKIWQKEFIYLGYYIADCPKMVYKGKFGGELWNWQDNNWIQLDSISNIIKDGKFHQFNSKLTDISTDLFGENGSKWSLIDQMNFKTGLRSFTKERELSFNKMKNHINKSQFGPVVVPGLEGGGEIYDNIGVLFVQDGQIAGRATFETIEDNLDLKFEVLETGKLFGKELSVFILNVV